ncbi:Ser-Thr-rich glycosyl-phosphatidyl-inositol-anchored membrane family-domain-containing protein [Annulohypoxylon truncatum]|uniref:Ser-Thr-rich glycosyl-phosphatidyl-inositol-anchored membrane family-domain-containing protein n=1 Tax=Annulohypoxylon truncatum TaxID=327061 RepID=UPI0020078FE4|nr:Ser-Thr-rich glycosyl-phosphatidyl-inositol-anchored membrane family-domain-containing protein [Annulohypoxylon truncatum]KAI1214007.1 Ser-Thr-rich glycosyl-phosphatidyl-inositol-anchored membrane family-domain-containing protein [Annulohypoxylon truncatum]
MRSTTIFASALAFAASAFAQTAGYAVMSSPTEGTKVESGKAFTIKWDAGKYTGQATISLLGGASPTTLSPGPVLTTIDVTAGSFTWNVDCSLGTDTTYGIKIASVADASVFQYSFPFAIEGPSCGAETTSRSASVSVSASAGGYPTAEVSSSSVVSSSSSSTVGYPTAPASSSSVVSSPPTYPTTAPVASYAVNSTTSAVVVPSYSASAPVYPSGNLSITASYPATTILTSAVGVTPSASATTSAPVTVVTGAAAANAAGSFALIGGMALAALAM